MKAEEVMKMENVDKRYKAFGREFTLKLGVDGKSVYLVSDDTGEDIEDIYNFYSLLYGEYEEVVNWDKVDVDTKILVSVSGKNREKRYFAKYENGKVYFFSCGASSYSVDDISNVLSWEYVKLYQE